MITNYVVWTESVEKNGKYMKVAKHKKYSTPGKVDKFRNIYVPSKVKDNKIMMIRGVRVYYTLPKSGKRGSKLIRLTQNAHTPICLGDTMEAVKECKKKLLK